MTFDEFRANYLPCKQGFTAWLSKVYHGIFESKCSCMSVPNLMDASWIYMVLWRVCYFFWITLLQSRTRVRLSLTSVRIVFVGKFSYAWAIKKYYYWLQKWTFFNNNIKKWNKTGQIQPNWSIKQFVWDEFWMSYIIFKID